MNSPWYENADVRDAYRCQRTRADAAEESISVAEYINRATITKPNWRAEWYAEYRRGAAILKTHRLRSHEVPSPHSPMPAYYLEKRG